MCEPAGRHCTIYHGGYCVAAKEGRQSALELGRGYGSCALLGRGLARNGVEHLRNLQVVAAGALVLDIGEFLKAAEWSTTPIAL